VNERHFSALERCPSPGSAFGKYEILSLPGAGGTGEVYSRATKLHREVAIKVLPEQFT
jgi:hypothetical protein